MRAQINGITSILYNGLVDVDYKGNKKKKKQRQ